MKIVRIGCLLVGFFLLVSGGNFSLLQAAVVVKTTAGQAVLVGGAEKARSEAVFDALGEALSSYIYGDMAVSHEFDQQINEKILKRRKRYVKSYKIQGERTLGDLYQIELRVELQGNLIKRALKKIERRKRRQVERLTLVVLPPVGTDENRLQVDNDGIHVQALEPTALLQSLRQELAVYGFSLKMARTISPNLNVMFEKVLKNSSAEGRRAPESAWFKGLLRGDLIIAVRSAEVREERIVSLQKSFWHSQAELVFIDMKNDMITHLPMVTAKVINSDYVVGLEKLTEELTGSVRKTCLERLLRDYIVPQESDLLVVLQCEGFRSPADFAVFKERLQALRTVKEVGLQALAAGSLDLGVRILTPAPRLIRWLNDFHPDDLPFTFEVYPLDEIPEHYLVRVIYAPTTGN